MAFGKRNQISPFSCVQGVKLLLRVVMRFLFKVLNLCAQYFREKHRYSRLCHVIRNNYRYFLCFLSLSSVFLHRRCISSFGNPVKMHPVVQTLSPLSQVTLWGCRFHFPKQLVGPMIACVITTEMFSPNRISPIRKFVCLFLTGGCHFFCYPRLLALGNPVFILHRKYALVTFWGIFPCVTGWPQRGQPAKPRPFGPRLGPLHAQFCHCRNDLGPSGPLHTQM